MTDDPHPPEPLEPTTPTPLGAPSNDVQDIDIAEVPTPFLDESEPFAPGEPSPEI